MIKFKWFLLASLCLHGILFFETKTPIMASSSAAPFAVSKVNVQFSQPKENINESQEKKQDTLQKKSKIKKTEAKKKNKPLQKAKQRKKAENKENLPNQNNPPSREHVPVMKEHKIADIPTVGQKNAPSLAHFIPPKYPERARRMNIEGAVLLKVLIGVDGKAHEIQVIQASHPLFVKAAKKSAQQSTFVPLTIKGIVKESWVKIPIKFILR